MVSLQGKFELADLKAAQNLHAMPGKRTWIGIIFLLGLFALLMVGAIVLAALGSLSWWMVAYPLFILAFVALYWFVLRPGQITRAYKQHKELSSPFEMDLTDEGYAIKNLYGAGRVPWKDFAKWKADKNIILLYRTDNMFNMVPRRLLQDESQTQYILEQLEKNGVKEASQVKNPARRLTQWIIYGLLAVIIIILLYMNFR